MSPQSEEPIIERQEREYRPLEPAELELMRESEAMAELTVLGANDIAPEDGPATPEMVEEEVRTHFSHRISDYHHDRASELAEFSVDWWNVATADVDEFELVVDNATREEDIQQFLRSNPALLTPLLGGGHGRYVIPKPELGSVGANVSHRVPDFLLAEMSSAGMTWYGVELERVNDKFHLKNGGFSAKLNHAIEQIMDWRSWLLTNAAHARLSRAEGGLGYPGLDANFEGFVFIGRREASSTRFNELRRQTQARDNIRIHSYDTLIEIVRGAARMHEKS